jgi:hypothetical protein
LLCEAGLGNSDFVLSPLLSFVSVFAFVFVFVFVFVRVLVCFSVASTCSDAFHVGLTHLELTVKEHVCGLEVTVADVVLVKERHPCMSSPNRSINQSINQSITRT